MWIEVTLNLLVGTIMTKVNTSKFTLDWVLVEVTVLTELHQAGEDNKVSFIVCL
jgi:hypothetical protein